jgi:hypothetical protein
MCSVPTKVPAADRARWLSELADALDQAHRVLFELDLDEDSVPCARDLHVRVEAARLQVQMLMLSRSIARSKETGPDWTNLLPWRAKRTGS